MNFIENKFHAFNVCVCMGEGGGVGSYPACLNQKLLTLAH